MASVLNVALKLAIFESRKKQKRIAKLARIPDTQLSHIVRGRRPASAEQRQRLATVLGKPEAVLFGAPADAPGGAGIVHENAIACTDEPGPRA